MALNLRSVSELPQLANSNDVNLQMALLSSVLATDIADIEVSFKNSTNSLSSYKFSFGLFMNYVVGYLSMLSANFANYLPLTAYDGKSSLAFDHLSNDFLPNHYVYTKYHGNIPADSVLYIEATKTFNITARNKNTVFYTPIEVQSTATIDTATIADATITNENVVSLTATNSNLNAAVATSLRTNNLTCTNSNYADLTAKCTRWN